jgi:hypothetical protein
MAAFQIFTQPSQQALDTAANVLSGATLTFTLTGTSTPTNAYSDSSLSTPVANPLSANSAGVWAPIFLDPAVTYRIVLKTQAGAVLQTWDPANEQLLTAAAIGALLFPRTGLEIAASTIPINYSRFASPIKDISRYVSDNTGSADVSVELNAAFAAEKNIIIPEGTYKFGSALGGPITLRQGQTITGAGRGDNSLGRTTTITVPTDLAPFISASVCAGIVLDNFCIVGPGMGSSTKTGLEFISAYQCILNRMLISGFNVGWKMRSVSSTSSFLNTASESLIFGSTTNIRAEHDSNALTLRQVTFGGGAAVGLYIVDSNSLNVEGGDAEGCTTCCIDIDASAPLTAGHRIDGTHFEGNPNTAGDIRIGNTALVRGVWIMAKFDPGTLADSGVNAVNCDGLVCYYQLGSGYTGKPFLRKTNLTNEVLVNLGSSSVQNYVQNNFKPNYADSDSLLFSAATNFDAAYADSATYNSYRMKAGSMTAAKNFYGAMDALEVTATGSPGAGSAAYGRAVYVSNAGLNNVRGLLVSGGSLDLTETTVGYSASITFRAGDASTFTITATNGTAFTINAPLNPVRGQPITVRIHNTSGGALGALTWNAIFKMSAWTQPANGFNRSITFEYNGTNWVQVSQTGVDVPN